MSRRITILQHTTQIILLSRNFLLTVYLRCLKTFWYSCGYKLTLNKAIIPKVNWQHRVSSDIDSPVRKSPCRWASRSRICQGTSRRAWWYSRDCRRRNRRCTACAPSCASCPRPVSAAHAASSSRSTPVTNNQHLYLKLHIGWTDFAIYIYIYIRYCRYFFNQI